MREESAVSIDKLPALAAKLNSTIEILWCHDSADSSMWAIQACFVCADYRTYILEGDEAGTIVEALESLLVKFEELSK